MTPHKSLENDGACTGDITLAIITNSILSVCLIIIIIISFVSTKHISKLKKPLPTPIKLLVYLSIFLSILCVLGFLLKFIVCPIYIHYKFIPWYIPIILDQMAVIGYQLFACTLLAILILRIYFSFDNSAFRMTKYQKLLFSILYSIVISSVITICIFNIIKAFGYSTTFILIIIGNTILIEVLLYFITSIYAIVVFANNLFSVIKLRHENGSRGYDHDSCTSSTPNSDQCRRPSTGCSPTDIPNLDHKFPKPPMVKPPKLNFTETKIIQQILRYVSLLSLAIFTTLLVVVQCFLTFAFTTEDNRSLMVRILNICATVDVVVNMTCLYLQHTFARKYYNKYCKWLECIWEYMLNTKLKPKSSRRNTLSMISLTILKLKSFSFSKDNDGDQDDEISTINFDKSNCKDGDNGHERVIHFKLNALMTDVEEEGEDLDMTDEDFEMIMAFRKYTNEQTQTSVGQFVE